MKKSRARRKAQVNLSDPRSYNVSMFWIFVLVCTAFVGLVALMVI